MGKRQRRRGRADAPAGETDDYLDPEGNVLTLRRDLSAKTVAKLREPGGAPGSSAEDRWQRRTELLFERLAVSWTIAGLPLTGQRELLGRYRMADASTRRWVRERLDEHVARHHPELGAG